MSRFRAHVAPTRPVLLVAVLLFAALGSGASVAHAQRAYVGFGVAVEGGRLPTLTLHVGGPLLPHLEVRATVDDLLSYYMEAAGDLLYTTAPAGGGVAWYVGGGPQVYLGGGSLLPAAGNGTVVYGLHLAGGTELPIAGGLGAYAEIEPATTLAFDLFLLNVRAGLDFHL